LTCRVRAAVQDPQSIAFVGVAGGDGTVRSTAESIGKISPDIALLVVPAGTRNHFARDVGIDSIDVAAEAADAGVVRLVDLGCVNDTVFVNNSSLGTYPSLVVEREGHERRLPKRLASVVAAWNQLRRGHRIMVDVDGVPCRVWAVFIGNNCYGETLRDLMGRERLDEGVLDLRLAHARGRLSRLRIVGSVLFGRVARSPLIERRTVSSVVIDAHRPIDVAIDGEVVTMSSPIHYSSCPRVLRVLVPRDAVSKD